MTAELARTLAAHERFEFRPGMLDQRGCRLTDRHIWDMPRDWEPPADMSGSWRLPDLTDDATAGVLVAMLTEAALVARQGLHFAISYDPTVRPLWSVDFNMHGLMFEGEYLGVAVAKALLAVLEDSDA